MTTDLKAVLIFFIVGLLLWTIGGSMIAMACFQFPVFPAIPKEELAADKELATQIMIAWSIIMAKTVGLWAITGGIIGVVISFLFITKPSHELYQPIPRITGMPRGPGPKTLAEVRTTFQAAAIGTIIGTCGVIFIPPLFQNELIAVNSLTIRIVFGVFESMIVTVPILPFSLKILSKIS